MEKEAFIELFSDNFCKNGLQAYVTPEIVDRFYCLTECMLRTNQSMNLTAITTPEKIIPLHYADCVKVAACIPQNARVADVGCGGGFPLLPLAIVRGDLTLTGIDSTGKKLSYVQGVAQELGLSLTTVTGRAESPELQALYRGAFDVVISRAVARLNILCELCIPYARVGGCFLAMKGAAGEEELKEALTGISTLGGSLKSMNDYRLYLQDGDEARTLVEVYKAQPTPPKYPRAFGVIKKRPL